MQPRDEQARGALNLEDNAESAALKCRRLVDRFRSSQSDTYEPLVPLEFVRGRNRRSWHQAVFQDAMRRYDVLKSYSRALTAAVEAYRANGDIDLEDRIIVDDASLPRMFRRWRKMMNAGADLSSKYDKNDFYEAILAGDADLAGLIFVSLSDQTKRKVAARTAKWLLVTHNN